MKVFWQQMLGYTVIILLAFMFFAFRIEKQTTENMIHSREEQLMNYGNNIVHNNFTRYDLVRTSQLLARENIMIQVYLQDGRIIYPTYDQRFQSTLTLEELNRLQAGEAIGMRQEEKVSANGEVQRALVVYLPHHDVGEFPEGFLSLAAPLDDLDKQLSDMRQNIILSLIISMGIALCLSALYSTFSTRKIRELQEAAREIAQGNYYVELPTDWQDEFGDLALDFQRMGDSLARSEKEIERQEKLRRQFMMDVAHEMRTPLTTMSGLLEGLTHGIIPAQKQQRSLELIEKETHRLTRLVNENLDYEKIRSRQVVLKKEVIRGSDIFNRIQTQLQSKADQKNIQIVTKPSEDLIIWGDRDRIVQVLINLVTNAIQFSQDSEVILSGTMHDDYSEIVVQDFGIGISPDDIKDIWERFYKVDESRKNNEFGESGIGLAVVKSLVEAHDGTIEVDSTLGEGTRFIIHLPHEK